MLSNTLNFQYLNSRQKQSFGGIRVNLPKKTPKIIKKLPKTKEPEGWQAYLSMQRKNRGIYSALLATGASSDSSIDIDSSTGNFVYYI